eukprot:CAMPEP_0181168912 /NCGR_PEP_ID=MMETSP1096-20121128/532_1 /TAXON_ID=156174 ORGANISM="Chrysochromulina ericina, Strain CCMP281" /NCGR_SAMPLE_ID=MMETSP1096 /ASSEMBLY_ACC=CAM_ASM_000453 /LENGTH=90 /DNA_ID=CAMNT_0023256331 /DNA_START=606 /DNA_END=875 /DNA_ORIENTATION=+
MRFPTGFYGIASMGWHAVRMELTHSSQVGAACPFGFGDHVVDAAPPRNAGCSSSWQASSSSLSSSSLSSSSSSIGAIEASGATRACASCW